MTGACKTELYPRYCFHLSSTVNTWCFLPARKIHALQQHAGFEGENFFFHKNLPIKWARIVGSVVAIDEFLGRRVYTLDDSSGRCMEAWVFLQSQAPGRPSPGVQLASTDASSTVAAGKDKIGCGALPSLAYDEIDIGHVLDVKGSLCLYKGEMQMKIEKFALVKSTAQEMLLWRKRSQFQRDVLNRPWVLEPRVIRRCRREAEASGSSLKRRKKRHEASADTASRGKGLARTSIARDPGFMESRREKPKPKPADVSAQLKQLIRDGSVKGRYGALGL
ncbi:hypothetical protein E4U42_003866 [Claviceps africana]|uniref:CST complex subunit Stn1 N-terminal domain-containing protein n=1 Tax=Claviceps africana TaxID=83212 RepID=A0A8K0JCN2_9HYPO|nr:hypothetical protein E4U42_003866 [Claviceps africana]